MSDITAGATLPQTSRYATASEARLMWLRFRRHRLAFAALMVTILIYLVALLAEPLAPFNPDKSNGR